jgi:hypothetical protein
MRLAFAAIIVFRLRALRALHVDYRRVPGVNWRLSGKSRSSGKPEPWKPSSIT